MWMNWALLFFCKMKLSSEELGYLAEEISKPRVEGVG